MERPEVAAKSFLLLDADVLEVLVPEDHNAPLGNEEGKLILLQIVKLGQLQATDLGANDGGQLVDLDLRVVLWDEV